MGTPNKATPNKGTSNKGTPNKGTPNKGIFPYLTPNLFSYGLISLLFSRH